MAHIHGESCGCGQKKIKNLKKKSLLNLAKWLGTQIYGIDGFSEFNDVWMDSRKLRKGDIFVALKGESQDGHDYVKSAFDNGALAAVVESGWYGENREKFTGFNLLPVKNVLLSVQNAAREYRRVLGIPVVAVTGSNGKTSSANMLKTLLENGFKVGATKGNFNNHIGVPLSILSMKGDEELAVFEIGANHAGEIAALTSIIEPDMGIITNVGYAHVGLFGSIEKTAEAKFELARAVSVKQGVLLLNGDDEMSVKQNDIDRVPAYYFGLRQDSQVRAGNVACDENGCYSFEYNKRRYELSMPGIHCVYSVLPALYIALSMGINAEILQKTIKELKPANMRGEIEIIAGRKIIADCYNANPSSMQTSLKMFNDIPAKANRVAVLGTMGELGGYETKLHEELGKSLANYNVDMLIAVGYCAKLIADGAISAGMDAGKIFVCGNAEEAGKTAYENSRENDLILFKGSRSVGLEKAIAVFSTLS